MLVALYAKGCTVHTAVKQHGMMAGRKPYSMLIY